MSFQKNNRTGIWSFLYYQERLNFVFPKIWSYSLDGKWKMVFLKKKKRKKKRNKNKNFIEIWYLLQTFTKVGIFKKITMEYDLSSIIWKYDIFSPKTWYFFFVLKIKDDLSQEVHGNIILSVYMYKSYENDILPKKSKKIFDGKNTLKGDILTF